MLKNSATGGASTCSAYKSAGSKVNESSSLLSRAAPTPYSQENLLSVPELSSPSYPTGESCSLRKAHPKVRLCSRKTFNRVAPRMLVSVEEIVTATPSLVEFLMDRLRSGSFRPSQA